MIKLIIDSTNIKAGGGLVHLKNIIANFDSNDIEVHIIGGPWIDKFSSKGYLKKIILVKELNSFFSSVFFKIFCLTNYFKSGDIAFIPGGTFFNKKYKYISMSQNMLVFDKNERNRYGLSLNWLRLVLLEKIQVKSFKNAAGVIYISHYAKNFIENKYPTLKTKKSTVIYHGISNDFRLNPRQQRSIKDYTKEKPFKLLYVSIVDYYKHQWNVIEAVKLIYDKGYPIELELIGPMNKSLENRMVTVLKGKESFVKYKGIVPHNEIAVSYLSADSFIFASTCENMPNILVEAMSAGLPILCSDYGPMPEILKDAGIYMDPTDVNSISTNLERLIVDESKRHYIAQKAYSYALGFSWEKSAAETIDFIKSITS